MTNRQSDQLAPKPSWGLVIFGAATSLLACQAGVVDESAPKANEVAAGSLRTSVVSQVPEHAVGGAARELAVLDQRRPLPLLPVMAWHQKQSMMQHLVVIQQIVAATAKQDWDAVASAAKGIEASETERRSCEHMGAGAEGFTELALDFHDRATLIGKAAEARDGAGVLEATAHTLQACTGCHATYRQELVDETNWKQRTGGHMPTPAMHE